MSTGRHGSGGGIVGSHLYMFSGAPTIGGASEIAGSERLELPDIVSPNTGVAKKVSSQGGGFGILLLAGLMCARIMRNTIP